MEYCGPDSTTPLLHYSTTPPLTMTDTGMFDLTGKLAMVTGASRGLGQVFGRALARAGADLVVSSRERESLRPFQKEVEALGRRCVPVALDVRNYESIQQGVDEAFAA